MGPCRMVGPLPLWACAAAIWCCPHLARLASARSVGIEECDRDLAAGIDWASVKEALWEAVEARSLADGEAVVEQLMAEAQGSACLVGLLSLAAVLAAHRSAAGMGRPAEELAAAKDAAGALDPLGAGVPLAAVLRGGFPLFGALHWMYAANKPVADEADELLQCEDELSRGFRTLLKHHLQEGSAVPSLRALEYLGAAASADACAAGRAAALLALALAQARGAREDDGGLVEVWHLVSEAEALLLRVVVSLSGRATGMLERKWAVWAILHRLMLAIARDNAPEKESPGGCIILIHAFPTEEIRQDTAKALQDLEKYYFQTVGVTYPLVIFADAGTAASLERELRPYTSAPIVPAVIPMEELAIPMASYSCVNGLDCQSGLTTNSSVHRGSLNGTQFWSPDYLRISRYTAGRLFLHEALDSCGHFLKMDTDFFFTAPVLKDPLAELRREGARLAYWQIHVQGQRQAGYMEAAVAYLKSRNMRIKNIAFYARGRFEEKAERLGIPLSEVPEALEAASVVYGCLFGGEVRFFREPLYQDFFKYMDERRGFETAGWSNQFFLGTAAAAFLFPSQVRRLYISGRHQESKIDVANGNVTEYLTGSSKSVFR